MKMKSVQELYSERLNRIKAAVALEKPDQVPVVLMGDAFCANHIGVKLSEFCSDLQLGNETQLKSFLALGNIDAIEIPHLSPAGFSAAWLANMKLPGQELPEGTLWQMDEKELITEDDYDTILDKGFNYFFFNYATAKLKPNTLPDLQALGGFIPQAVKNFEDAGMVAFCPVATGLPYDALCGGRTLARFTRDIFKMPDKIQAVMDVIMIDLLAGLRQQLRHIKPYAVWINGMRGASEFVSPKIWDRLVFPYLKKIVETIVEEGSIAYLHCDANWERDLEHFKELPRGKCVFGTDHETDIFKAKKILGNHMCIMGDVPPALLAISSPDEVYNYASKLVKEIGPDGFILSQGCDIPPNAKVENVKAMIAAATGK
jgi:hypothetical protein